MLSLLKGSSYYLIPSFESQMGWTGAESSTKEGVTPCFFHEFSGGSIIEGSASLNSYLEGKTL